MKRLLISAAAAAALVTGLALGLHSMRNLDPILEANVEALTSGEGNYDYPDGYPYSVKCNVSLGGLRKCQATVITCQGGGSGCNERPCPVHH